MFRLFLSLTAALYPSLLNLSLVHVFLKPPCGERPT